MVDCLGILVEAFGLRVPSLGFRVAASGFRLHRLGECAPSQPEHEVDVTLLPLVSCFAFFVYHHSSFGVWGKMVYQLWFEAITFIIQGFICH